MEWKNGASSGLNHFLFFLLVYSIASILGSNKYFRNVPAVFSGLDKGLFTILLLKVSGKEEINNDHTGKAHQPPS